MLGLRLQNLTLGHLFALEDVGIDIEALTPAEVPAFAFICSQDYAESLADIKRWWAPLYFRIWGRLRAGVECDEPVDYIRWHMSGPSFWVEGGKRQPVGSPIHIHLLAVLMGELGMTREQAMNEPVKRALQLRASIAEKAGAKLVTKEQIQFEMACREADRLKGVAHGAV